MATTREQILGLQRDVMLEHHLQGNCYPPVGLQFLPFAKRAIEMANEGHWDEVVEVDGSGLVNWADELFTARGMMEWLHLDCFLD